MSKLSGMATLLSITFGIMNAQDAMPNQLWYEQPARNWVEALPIGNGRLGGMVFGGIELEHVQLNEDTIWAGEKRDRLNPEGAASLPRVRQLLGEGKLKEAEALADATIIAKPRRMPPYQPAGDLWLKFKDTGRVQNYKRVLDLDTATTRVDFETQGAHCTRETFASAVDQVIVMSLSCDKPGMINFATSLSREQDAKSSTMPPNRVVL